VDIQDPTASVATAVAAAAAVVADGASDGVPKKKKKQQLAAAAAAAATTSGSDVSTVFGYCHISHTADTRVENLAGEFPVGSSHPVRCLYLHPFDGLVHVSMRPSVLAQSVLRHEDLTLGMDVQGV
jgi:hypothetical protein